MSENVIDKLVVRLRERADRFAHRGAPDLYHEARDDGAEDALIEAADELQAITRPEQFMPPLSEWPEDAVYIVVCIVQYLSDKQEFEVTAEFVDKDGCGMVDKPENLLTLRIPLGIDPRIKVSRAQMEKWEAENG